MLSRWCDSELKIKDIRFENVLRAPETVVIMNATSQTNTKKKQTIARVRRQ